MLTSYLYCDTALGLGNVPLAICSACRGLGLCIVPADTSATTLPRALGRAI